MRVGFIGLGNAGGKLAGNLQRNGYQLVVRDLNKALAQPFIDAGAGWAETPQQLAEMCDVVITCLPSPAAVTTTSPSRYPSHPGHLQAGPGNLRSPLLVIGNRQEAGRRLRRRSAGTLFP
jgi:prephenate dehydrogenase